MEYRAKFYLFSTTYVPAMALGILSHRSITAKRFNANCILQGHEHAEQVPGLLGTTENELGIRRWIEDQGHELVTTSDKEGENSTFDKHLVDAEVIITTPYAFTSTVLGVDLLRSTASAEHNWANKGCPLIASTLAT